MVAGIGLIITFAVLAAVLLYLRKDGVLVHLLRRLSGWALMMTSLPFLFAAYLLTAWVFVTLRAVSCKPASVKIKLT
jgi:hypothetical protein